MSSSIQPGKITENDLMQRLVNAKKVMKKVDNGNFYGGSNPTTSTVSESNEIPVNMEQPIQEPFSAEKLMNQPPPNAQKIMESKLPDAIKQAMIERPIAQISLGDSLDMNFVEKTKRLMAESEGGSTSKPKPVSKQPVSKRPQSSEPINLPEDSTLVEQLTPIIENIVRKTIGEIMDRKLDQMLTAQQTMSINENLVLKVGDSIFKGKITGVKKTK